MLIRYGYYLNYVQINCERDIYLYIRLGYSLIDKYVTFKDENA